MARKSGKSQDGFTETLKTVVYAVLIAVVFRTVLFQPFWIPSGSMKSTLLIGDYLFISKYSYGYSKHSFPWSTGPFEGRILGSAPERGDVAVFKHPKTGEDYIKRVIGLPGDSIRVTEGVLHINETPVGLKPAGEFMDRSVAPCIEKRQVEGEILCVREAFEETLPNGRTHIILNSDANLNARSDNTRTFTVPEGHFFMMGDNRDNSTDSRMDVGYVPFENFVGRAEMIAISSDGPFYEFWNWRFSRFLSVIR